MQENTHYRWVSDRLLFRDAISEKDTITILYYPGERSQYGGRNREIYAVLDPAQKFMGDK